jgi:hypothetical protein
MNECSEGVPIRACQLYKGYCGRLEWVADSGQIIDGSGKPCPEPCPSLPEVEHEPDKVRGKEALHPSRKTPKIQLI